MTPEQYSALLHGLQHILIVNRPFSSDKLSSGSGAYQMSPADFPDTYADWNRNLLKMHSNQRIPDIHARLRSDMLHCNGLYKSLISRCCKGAACLWLWNYIYNRNPLSCRQLSFNNNRSV